MNEMVERVARAIYESGWDLTWENAPEHVKDDARRDARAGIEAMREPTEGMGRAGDAVAGIFRSRSTWRDMIDEALK